MKLIMNLQKYIKHTCDVDVKIGSVPKPYIIRMNKGELCKFDA